MTIYSIVYQFGKVASTSIVSTLNSIDDIKAVQCHFIGEQALKKIIPTITNPKVSDYFFEHQLGQFISNTKITRQFNLIRSGAASSRLLVISLSRNPLEWFRSSVTQDIKGYIPFFKKFLERKNIECAEDDVIKTSLPKILNIYEEFIYKFGGIDQFQQKYGQLGPLVFDGHEMNDDYQMQSFFNMMLRPINWFDVHFNKAIGFSLEEMDRIGSLWHKSDAYSDYFIIKYENLKDDLNKVLLSIGIDAPPVLKRENVSSAKEYSDDIKDVFSSFRDSKLSKYYSETQYSNIFGYE